MRQKLVKNLPLLIVIVILLLLTNGITYFHTSKINTKEYRNKLDSIKTQYELAQLNLRHLAIIREEQYKIDSATVAKLNLRIKTDSNLIVLQRKALSKFKNRPDKELLKALDSAYEANN